jgi:hypothetical protein
MIKLMDILKEIGDASMAVNYRKVGEDKQKYQTVIGYEFEIGKDIYIVTMYVSEIDTSLPSKKDYEDGNTGIQIMFGLKTDTYSDVGDTSRTNKGVQYQVMSTVIKILKDYISKHPELVEISYEPVKKNAEDQGREKLYQIYIQKNLSDWKYTKDSYGWIYLNKPPKASKSLFKRFFNK